MIHVRRLGWSCLNAVLFPLVGFAAPTINVQPADLAVTAGQNATLTVGATDTGQLSYQWRRSGFTVPDATSSTFVIGRASRSDAGYYSVDVTDGSGMIASRTAGVAVAPTSYPSATLADASFDLNLESTTTLRVSAIAPLRDGSFIAGGWIASVGGQKRRLVFKVNADGTLNTAFIPAKILGVTVNSIVVQSDGKILIGGCFWQVGTERRNCLARLNADGSLDATFVPAFEDVDEVKTILVANDGHVYVACGGYGFALRKLNADGTADPTWKFPTYGSAQVSALEDDGKVVLFGWAPQYDTNWALMRINTDGTKDTGFTAPPVSGNINALAQDSVGRWLVGGAYTLNGNATYLGLVRLARDGTLDSTFNAPLSGTIDITDVAALALQPDGKILVGGIVLMVSGTSTSGVVRLKSDGTPDAFTPGQPVDMVYALAVLADGEIIAGLEHRDTSAPAPRTGLASYSPDGALDARVTLSMRGPGLVTAVCALGQQRTLLFGQFDYADGMATQGMVRLNSDNSIDRTFHPSSPVVTKGGMVTWAIPLPDGRVVIAGNLKISFTDPNAQIALLRTDLTVDPFTSFAAGGRAFVEDVVLTPDGKLLALGPKQGTSVPLPGGTTTTLPGSIVTRYALNGAIDSTFSSSSDIPSVASELAVQGDGKVLVGGWVTGSNTTPGIMRLNSDGTRDSTFNAPTTLRGVTHIVPLVDGKLIIASGSMNAGTVQRLNGDGSVDAGFTRAQIGYPRAMLVQEDGAVLIRTRTPNSTQHNEYMARLTSTGAIDSTFRALGLYQPPYASLAISGTQSTILMRDDGRIFVADSAGSATAMVPTTAPVLTSVPDAQVVAPGANAKLSVVAQSDTPTTFQWYLNGAAITGATSATYTIPNFGVTNIGSYTVAVANLIGSTTSNPVSITAPRYTKGRLSNFSIRANAGSGDARLIVGVVLGGAGTGGNKSLLIRGVGPTLGAYGVTGFLADPTLEIYDPTGFKVDQNDDWTGVFPFGSLGAFPFVGTAPKDAAIYNPYATNGVQTVHVVGKNGATGVALAEVYDATPDDAFNAFTPRIVNGSARTMAAGGENAVILGFVVGAAGSEHLLVRAAGPTLAAAPFNVSGALPDPVLEIYADKTKIGENDNWADNGAGDTMETAFKSVGAFSFASRTSKDSALVVTLPPGSYTAVVHGTNDTAGIVLVELYEIP